MRVGGQCHSWAALSLGNEPGTHYTGGWVGPRAILDKCRKSWLHHLSISRPSRLWQVA